jgi:hypothetical protein
MYVFTNKRLILIDKQGITGRKVDYHSIPYRAITQFKIETAGHFDLDAELKIWISGYLNIWAIQPNRKRIKERYRCRHSKNISDAYVRLGTVDSHIR